MIRLEKFTKILIVFFSTGVLSGCLSSLMGTNNGQYRFNPYQQPYQQGQLQQGQFNQMGTLQQGQFNQMGTLQQEMMGFNQNSGQSTLGQAQVRNQQSLYPPGYSESGYQPGYPRITKPSYQGWTDPDRAEGIW